MSSSQWPVVSRLRIAGLGSDIMAFRLRRLLLLATGYWLLATGYCMKKIVISTFGSFGDLHPYVAIALELKRRGHRPVFVTSEIYREKLDALGLELRPSPPHLPDWEQPDEVRRLVGDLIDARKGSERVFNEFVNPHLRGMYEALAEAARDADLLLTHVLSLTGPPLVEKTGLPGVSTAL